MFIMIIPQPPTFVKGGRFPGSRKAGDAYTDSVSHEKEDTR